MSTSAEPEKDVEPATDPAAEPEAVAADSDAPADQAQVPEAAAEDEAEPEAAAEDEAEPDAAADDDAEPEAEAQETEGSGRRLRRRRRKAAESVAQGGDEADGEGPEAQADAEEPQDDADEPKSPAQPPARTRSSPSRRRGRRDPDLPAPVVRAQAKYVRSSARKARLVCDNIRGKSVDEARAILALTPRAIARDWSKLLESAIANAEHNHELVGEDLYVKSVTADEGPTIKRFRPRAMGRATRIRKRTSHLTILLTPKD
jgi:ribosomal protein L22